MKLYKDIFATWMRRTEGKNTEKSKKHAFEKTADGQCKNSQVKPQLIVSYLIKLDCNILRTLDMLDC